METASRKIDINDVTVNTASAHIDENFHKTAGIFQVVRTIRKLAELGTGHVYKLRTRLTQKLHFFTKRQRFVKNPSLFNSVFIKFSV